MKQWVKGKEQLKVRKIERKIGQQPGAMKSTSNYEANKRKISQQTVATNKIVYLFRWELRKRTKIGIHIWNMSVLIRPKYFSAYMIWICAGNCSILDVKAESHARGWGQEDWHTQSRKSLPGISPISFLCIYQCKNEKVPCQILDIMQI